ncbi:hypothetical protein [Natronorarus salvus]
MRLNDEELAEAYRENAENARSINEEWGDISTKANQHLGENPLKEN